MTLRSWAELALVVAACVVLVFSIVEHNAKVAARAQLELVREEVAVARQIAQEREREFTAARARSDSSVAALQQLTQRAAALSDSLHAAVVVTLVVVDVAGADLQDLIVQMRELLPEEARELADSAALRATTVQAGALSAAQAFQQQAESFAAYRAQTETALADKDRALWVADRTIDEWKAVAIAEAARADLAEQLATPGIWKRIRTSLPFFSVEGTVAGALGVTVGVLATR